jgi:lipopolysaccharide/colanic/teichoic acid biosynthesis glycosyltransferase/GGDEF domain-containing protein
MSREPTAELPNQRPSIAGVDWFTMRAVAARAAWAPKLARHIRMPVTAADDPVELLDDASAEIVHLDDFVLPRHHFLKALQRERWRADRSKSPLSIALFRYHGARGDEFRRVTELLDFFRGAARQTDILGNLGDQTIALVLPDTNSQGTQQFAKKVAKRVSELEFTSTTGTYPNDVFDDLLTGNRDLAQAHPLFIDRPRGPDNISRLLKRCIDVNSAAVAIVLLSPLMLVTAAAIALTSPGPVIYRQIRLGKGGVPFTFYKFRSMGRNLADEVHREYVIGLIRGAQGHDADGNAPRPWTKLRSDPRITAVGRFIRRTSIDELPQLFNVLKGDLSLIGPRPALPYEAENYQSWHLRRILEIKPGVSGLWQVEAGPNTTFDDMVRLDLLYMRKWSLMLDLKIMIKTVQVVLRRPDAG